MNEFESYQSYLQFQHAVRRKNRYIHNDEVKNFLQAVLETSKSKIEELNEGIIFWRSQSGHYWEPFYLNGEYLCDAPCPFHPERMKPLQNSAFEGRANPQGITYLYLSTDMNTAMAEIRPWIGSYISLAQFKLSKNIKIINCTSEEKEYKDYIEEPNPKVREIAVWGDIDRAFSTPVTPNESTADYVPTQIIAELFKNSGFDGIAYRSSLGEGHNIVLFDLDSADFINCTLYKTEKVSFKFIPYSDTYIRSRYYKK